MNKETVLVFALGMIFYHGICSSTKEKGKKVASILALVLFFHKAVFNMHIREFLHKIGNSKSASLSGVVLFVCILAVMESIIMYAVQGFFPGTMIYIIERMGGCVVLISLLFIFSSLWILSKNDITECIFIDQGVYAYIRHPYYLGLFLLYMGICFMLVSVCSVIIAIFILKDRVIEYILEEESLLIEKHKSYIKYKERVYSGIPTRILSKIKSTDSFVSTFTLIK
ncbi:protein-S-isoprenylcysteine O-methyltransferase [Nematocida parisii]|uniref:Protein-S-isoprenylcysteine O-methyltransferase n=1 Tax=Nematocida parisii (strain ERTm3) TaxID=935791 RepID=I3EEY0_NEMP3|nr:uncharacterized protein NEPG_01957 [Nematocida parisii ERTm1]EIJ87777.1 hypothetical protein NEQG_01849 [Nematocida parisii ERTm3]KAI5127222.1 protein-S-isoprenylcysteine O-methyltransferase [Nematocida parisii]EIJ93002.1 hypothetical protein NEPG_01957 [Nematocida parisii ERTm1]KAI5127281.1 protein-S-isoprenylcysteine O-methyltransferase [Nematocida parisii]KAI5141389.1 protein-S-isoprenylcysteine O-methyltransferase [Nematocida parisii]|eukprot:XP_013059785.1 hypothetical protein NEPG_01957 [Nematocida parisii ERTm1]